MYQAFFGFRERPFQLTPNPRFLFLNPGHREALATLRYGLSSSLGITLLLGEAGTGKTTLLRAALDAERAPEAPPRRPEQPDADARGLLRDSGRARSASAATARPRRAGSCWPSRRDVLERHEAGGMTALVIDEAHSLTHELFEEIRLLANLETPTAKLVNVDPRRPAGTGRAPERPVAPSVQAAGRPALLAGAARPRVDRLLHRVAPARGRGGGRRGVHEGSRARDLRGLARHPADHRRHLRERAARGLRGAEEAGRPGRSSPTCAGTSTSPLDGQLPARGGAGRRCRAASAQPRRTRLRAVPARGLRP